MVILEKYWKQFAVWVTGSEDRVFQKANLKLTLYYTVLIMFVSGLCSILLYFSLRKNMERDFAYEGNARAVMIERGLSDLQRNIVSVNVSVLAIGSVLGYILARRTLRPLGDWIEMQKQFSANASHELRTPLAIMKTDSEVILRGKKNSVQDFRLLTARNMEEIDRMSKIVEDLLVLSREKNVKKIPFKKINLSRMVRKLVHKMKKPAIEKDIEIILETMEGGFFYGDASALEQAILNVLQNAINYTPRGGRIIACVKNGRRHLILTVADNGVGIEKEKLSHIFERFYKAGSGEDNNKGSGLGLAIVKEIIDNAAGKIRITSKLKSGTRVTIWLPKAVD